MIAAVLDRPWLRADLGGPHLVLSWAPYRPGFVTATHALWREVRDADLTPGFDAEAWLAPQCADDAVAFLTSRNIGKAHHKTAPPGLPVTECLATVGLSNAERIGTRQSPPAATGTINILLRTDALLSRPAMIEGLSLVAQARTAAVMDHGPDLPQGRATGTGTDCIALAVPAVPLQGGDIAYAGLHTEIGEAIGRATYDAVAAGVRQWTDEEGGA